MKPKVLYGQIARIITDALLNYETSESKLVFGISFYDDTTGANVNKLAIQIKKAFKVKKSKSVRFVPSDTNILSAAQVIHNHLQDKGIEFLVAFAGDAAIVARTTQIQNIDFYSKRDFGRPLRDPKVGMLPPKLAQIMINLAKPDSGGVIVDPYCGTGVILQS